MELLAVLLLTISVAVFTAMTVRARRPLQTISPSPLEFQIPLATAYSELKKKLASDLAAGQDQHFLPTSD
jgi:hypothetical protein